ncbi:MAG: methyltransferase domain-containing protein [Acidimicrobiales bacterium]
MVDVYTHGHHESVLRSHAWRNLANSASYLAGSLLPGMSLLDVGCGPGTITAELAERLAPGTVVGLDASFEVLGRVRTGADGPHVTNLTLACADAYQLPIAEQSFDVVHAHQVLQHLSRPVDALREMHRVLRPEGILAVRDADYGSFVWAPTDRILDRWLELYLAVTARNGAVACAGRHLPAWVHAAGFRSLVTTTSTWTFAEPDQRQWWGELWADRTVHSSFGLQARRYGFADDAELAGIADAWRRWAAAPQGFFALLHGEVLATR